MHKTVIDEANIVQDTPRLQQRTGAPVAYVAPKEPDETFVEGPWGQLYRVSAKDRAAAMGVMGQEEPQRPEAPRALVDDPNDYASDVDGLMALIDAIFSFTRGALFGLSAFLLVMFPTQALGAHNEVTGSNNFYFLAAYCEMGVTAQKLTLAMAASCMAACLARGARRLAESEITASDTGPAVAMARTTLRPFFCCAPLTHMDPHMVLLGVCLAATVVTTACEEILWEHTEDIRQGLGVYKSEMFPSSVPDRANSNGLWLEGEYARQTMRGLSIATSVRVAAVAASWLYDQRRWCWRPRRPTAVGPL